MAYAVLAESVEKTFGDHRVLVGVDLAVPAGTIHALLGPNGAGKTTFVRILSTLLPADRGRIEVAGHDVVAAPAAVRRAISLTGQQVALDEVLTGEENLVLLGRLRKLPAPTARLRARELLDRFGLADAAGRRVATYSGGMQRRLDLAAGLLVRPEVLFLDEPTTGLDPRSRDAIWSAVRDLADDGVTVLLTTQYLEEADRLAHRVSVLHGGRIVQEGSPAELKATLGTEVVRLELAGGAVVEVPTDGTARALADVLADHDRRGIDVRRVDLVRPTLDDVFLALTADAAA